MQYYIICCNWIKKYNMIFTTSALTSILKERYKFSNVGFKKNIVLQWRVQSTLKALLCTISTALKLYVIRTVNNESSRGRKVWNNRQDLPNFWQTFWRYRT